MATKPKTGKVKNLDDPPPTRWVANAFFAENNPATKRPRLDEVRNLQNANLAGATDTTDYELAAMVIERAALSSHPRAEEMRNALSSFFSSIPDPAMKWINPTYEDTLTARPTIDYSPTEINANGGEVNFLLTGGPKNASGFVKLHSAAPGGGIVQDWFFRTDDEGEHETELQINALPAGDYHFTTSVGFIGFRNWEFKVSSPEPKLSIVPTSQDHGVQVEVAIDISQMNPSYPGTVVFRHKDSEAVEITKPFETDRTGNASVTLTVPRSAEVDNYVIYALTGEIKSPEINYKIKEVSKN